MDRKQTPYPPDWGDEDQHLPRAYEFHGFTTLYRKRGKWAHIVPNDSLNRTFCGMDADRHGWLGTGNWEEVTRGRRLPLCPNCVDRALTAYPRTCRVERVGDQ